MQTLSLDMKNFLLTIQESNDECYTTSQDRTATFEENKLVAVYKINPFKSIKGAQLTFLTEEGKSIVNQIKNQNQTESIKMNVATLEQPTAFVIESFAIAKTRTSKPSKFPFDQLQVGQHFHVPGASKSILTTVGQFNRRFGTPTGEMKTYKPSTKYPNGRQIAICNYSRKFSCVKVDESDPNGPGYRVIRTI